MAAFSTEELKSKAEELVKKITDNKTLLSKFKADPKETVRFAPTTRSIAPPIPFTILPGIIQFAKSTVSETSNTELISLSVSSS